MKGLKMNDELERKEAVVAKFQYIPPFTLRDCGKPRKTSVRITGHRAKI
jgi:hypothetical protein